MTPKYMSDTSKCIVAVAGTGYVGLSLAVLLARHNKVLAVDIVPEKVSLSMNANLRLRMITLKNILPKNLLI